VVDERDSAQGTGEARRVGDSQETPAEQTEEAGRSGGRAGAGRSGLDEERSDEEGLRRSRGKENPSPVMERVVVVRGGLEPPTFRFSGGRSTS
jgi:hypothetical protein